MPGHRQDWGHGCGCSGSQLTCKNCRNNPAVISDIDDTVCGETLWNICSPDAYNARLQSQSVLQKISGPTPFAAWHIQKGKCVPLDESYLTWLAQKQMHMNIWEMKFDLFQLRNLTILLLFCMIMVFMLPVNLT